MRYLLEITITRDNTAEIGIPDYIKLEAKNLTQLLSQLPLAIATHVKKVEQDMRLILNDDDIPF